MFIGALAQGFPPLVVVCSNASGNSGGLSGSGNVASDTGGHVTVSGGSGSYSYSFTRLSTSQGPSPTILSGDGTADPVFRALSVSDGTPSISTWRVTVTDEAGNTQTDDFTVTLTWTNNS
jgi:hypothetical protein